MVRRYSSWMVAGLLGISLCEAGDAQPAKRTDLASADAHNQQIPGELIALESGRRLHIFCAGEGRPTVIFEATGGSPGVTDMPVLRRVTATTRACLYDRAGLGWSDSAPSGRSFEDRAVDLHALLGRAGVRGPYVLVGGSFGGLIARTYNRLYPNDVAGMVLVDSAEEGQWFPLMAATRNSNEQILLHMVARAESGELRKALESNAKGATWYNEAEKRWLERFPSDMNLFVRRGLP